MISFLKLRDNFLFGNTMEFSNMESEGTSTLHPGIIEKKLLVGVNKIIKRIFCPTHPVW